MFTHTQTSVALSNIDSNPCWRCGNFFLQHLWYWFNQLLVLIVLAVLITRYGSLGPEQTCPVTAAHAGLVRIGAATEDGLAFDNGITFSLPPSAIYAVGATALAVGGVMLSCGLRLQRVFTALLVLGALALYAESAAMQQLLYKPPEADLAVGLFLESDGVTTFRFRVDLPCAGSVLLLLIAISIGLHLITQPLFGRVLSFVEGAICGILAVRLAADFFPPLLEAMPGPFDEAGATPKAFLGYPLIPFWSAAGVAALIIGVMPEGETMTILITAFFGAFAAAKGVRTLQDAAAGLDALELAGGSRVHSDVVQGGLQLGLFVVGVWGGRMRAACDPNRPQPPPSAACCGLGSCCCGCFSCGSCWPCCVEDEEVGAPPSAPPPRPPPSNARQYSAML